MTGPTRRRTEDDAGNPTRVHIIAVNKAVRSAGGLLGDTEAPLVETLRVLARQMDASGGAASTRLSTAYLSALRDLQRMLAKNSSKGGARGRGGLALLRAEREGREAG